MAILRRSIVRIVLSPSPVFTRCMIITQQSWKTFYIILIPKILKISEITGVQSIILFTSFSDVNCPWMCSTYVLHSLWRIRFCKVLTTFVPSTNYLTMNIIAIQILILGRPGYSRDCYKELSCYFFENLYLYHQRHT